MEEAYATEITSFTKQETNTVSVLKKFLPAGQNILIIDDFLANGESALGLTRLVEMAGSTVAGIGIAIEKSFQPGQERIKAAGYKLCSLARIKSLGNCKIEFMD